MTPSPCADAPAFPRYFRFFGQWVSAYKVFLCIGIYVGVLVSAAAAEHSGLSPLGVGLGCLACAIGGLFGARIYHLLVFAPHYLRQKSWAQIWDSRRGGWSVFGALVPLGIIALGAASALGVSVAVFWDHMICGIVAGAVFVRVGCICNGCCGGRETQGWLGLHQHDARGICKRRIPVQLLEIGWWLAAAAGLWQLWPLGLPAGSLALAVLGWYGAGRFWLETLRDAPDRVFDRLRINRIVAALLALGAGTALFILIRTGA